VFRVTDGTAQIDRKIEMLACYTSQREWLRSHHGMDEYIEAIKRGLLAHSELLRPSTPKLLNGKPLKTSVGETEA